MAAAKKTSTRYSLAQLNSNTALAARIRELVFSIVDGSVAPTNTRESLTAVAIIQAKRRAGASVCRPQAAAKFEGTVTVDGETFARYSGVTL